MRFRILVGVAVVGLAAAATLAARDLAAPGSPKICCVEGHACCAEEAATCCDTRGRQSAIVNFVDTVMVNRKLVSGPVLIVHDDERMARGEACTTFYRFDPAEGPKEEMLSFHCEPRRTSRVDTTKLTTVPGELGVKRLIEFQLAGDSEAHGIPR